MRVYGFLSLLVGVGTLPAQDKKPAVPDAASIQAVQRIFGTYGCMFEAPEMPGFVNSPVDRPPYHIRDGIAAFQFSAPPRGELPPVAVPFGINIRGGVSDEDMKALAGWKNLTRLKLERTSITTVGLRELKACETLEELALAGAGKLTRESLRELKDFKKLRTLYLSTNAFTDEWTAELVACGSLTSVYIRDAQLTDGGAAHLAKMQNLRRLDVWRSKITDEGLKELAKIPTLESLSVGDSVGPAGFKHLKGCRALRELSGFGLTAEALAALREAGQLHCLRPFWQKPFEGPATDADVKYLLSGNEIRATDEVMKELGRIPTLEVVRLGFDKSLTDKGLLELAGCKSLKLVEVFGTKVTAEGAKALQAALPMCRVELR